VKRAGVQLRSKPLILAKIVKKDRHVSHR
jgi:hypothetical protein